MDEFLNMGSLSAAIRGASGLVLDYALLLAAIGISAMALLELIKSVFFLRPFYHYYMFRRWIDKNDAEILDEVLLIATSEKQKKRNLVWRPFYDQPTDKLLGQLQAAANVALDYPDVYFNFYTFLVKGSEQTGTPPADKDIWIGFVKNPPQKSPGESDEQTNQKSRAASQARARLGNFIARKLDALQTRLEYWWAFWNQAAAFALGAGLFGYMVHHTIDDSNISRLTLGFIAILSGLAAPFMKDVMTALAGLRARRG